ncbi:class I SAM-dependent methyltransferase [bacterium]|nr:class I SAM-dependent methyltransferase [bacterium]
MESAQEISIATSSTLETVKTRQHSAWSSGNYSMIGTTLQIVGESLVHAVDIRAGQRVLDVAAGNGNASLAAARHFTHVTAVDYVPALLESAQERAKAEGLIIDFRQADAEALPFESRSFDVVLSTFGVMFTPNQEKAASELLRVCKPGGKIGLANWTPEGFVGQLFKLLAKYIPPMPGVKPPSAWGLESNLQELFGNSVSLFSKRRYFVFRYLSAQHWIDVFRAYYGPVLKAFAALDAEQQSNLNKDLLLLLESYNRSDNGTLVVPSEYLEVVGLRH